MFDVHTATSPHAKFEAGVSAFPSDSKTALSSLLYSAETLDLPSRCVPQKNLAPKYTYSTQFLKTHKVYVVNPYISSK